MKLYLVSRTDDWGWDDYDGFVIRASSMDEALGLIDSWGSTKPAQDQIDIVDLGQANEDEAGVILSSFHAG